MNGQSQEVMIYPYKDRKGRINYRYKKRPYSCNGSRQNDSAACNHSDLIKSNFNVKSEGIDLPDSNTEIKETRQDKYYIQEKDREADQFLFYNHRTQEYKIVKRNDYENVMGKLDHTQTPTQNQVDHMHGYNTKDPARIKNRI